MADQDSHGRDLIHPDEVALFTESLERARRRRRGLPDVPPPPATGTRDLSDPELTRESLRRALLKRRIAEERGLLDHTPVKKVAATAAITGLFVSSGAPVLGALNTPTAIAATQGVLKQGDSGASVRSVQRALGIGADGIFGPATERAVKRFQRAHGLTADGIVGPATRAALGASHTTSRGGSGGSVARLQRLLGVGSDGVFGPQTAAAVRSFQSRHGLTADGIVGPATWAALGASGPVLKQRGKGARSASASTPAAVQRAIAAGNRIAGLPYKYGGGHGSFEDTGYDCSGSVSYVLHAAGVLSSPLTSGALMSYGEPGPGRHITIYANPGHTYMVIDGRRFDTTGRSENGTRWQGAQRSSAGYTVRHPPGL